jgi:hypothetical protein
MLEASKVDKAREWKTLAIYLANCHAATAYGVLERKSSSKAEKERHKAICKLALVSLKEGRLIGKIPSDLSSTIQRLEKYIGCFDAAGVK